MLVNSSAINKGRSPWQSARHGDGEDADDRKAPFLLWTLWLSFCNDIICLYVLGVCENNAQMSVRLSNTYCIHYIMTSYYLWPSLGSRNYCKDSKELFLSLCYRSWLTRDLKRSDRPIFLQVWGNFITRNEWESSSSSVPDRLLLSAY